MTSWNCPPCSVLCVLADKPVCEEARWEILRQTDEKIRSWAEEHDIDMKWRMTARASDVWTCGVVHSTNFENEITRFPPEFLKSFVGKPWCGRSSFSIVVSTCS